MTRAENSVKADTLAQLYFRLLLPRKRFRAVDRVIKSFNFIGLALNISLYILNFPPKLLAVSRNLTSRY